MLYCLEDSDKDKYVQRANLNPSTSSTSLSTYHNITFLFVQMESLGLYKTSLM